MQIHMHGCSYFEMQKTRLAKLNVMIYKNINLRRQSSVFDTVYPIKIKVLYASKCKPKDK
jgi:hypothetical protein